MPIVSIMWFCLTIGAYWRSLKFSWLNAVHNNTSFGPNAANELTVIKTED